MTALRRMDLVPIDLDDDGHRDVPSPARVRRMDQRLKSRIGFTCATVLMAGVALILWDRSEPASRRAPASAAAGAPGATAAPTIRLGAQTAVTQAPVPGVTVAAVLPTAAASASGAEPARTAQPTQVAVSAQPTASPRQAAPVLTSQRTRIHTVEKGDTLFSLARRYGTTVDAIVALNGLGTTSAPLRIGRELTVL